MLKRLMPAITLFLAFLLDTCVIPVFYRGSFAVLLTLSVALCITLLMGFLKGLIYGFAFGLLMDITVGTAPFNSLVFIASCALCGLIVQEEKDKLSSDLQFHLRRFGIAFGLFFLQDVFYAIYGYFQTAMFNANTLRDLFLRSLIFAALTVVLCPQLAKCYPPRPHETSPEQQEIQML